MNKRQAQLFLAHNSSADQTSESVEPERDDHAISLQPREAASYIADLLSSLRMIAVKAGLQPLSDLISVAEEEAKLRS
jgi:hypothetical protein